MKRLIVFGFFLFPFFAQQVAAQFVADTVQQELSPRKTKRMATKLYKKASFYNSLEYWEKYYEKKPEKTATIEKIANLNFQLRDYKLAEKWYKTLMETDPEKFPKAQYSYALMQKYNGKYDESRENFSTFVNRYLADDSEEFIKLANKHIAGCDTAKALIADPLRVNITHFDERINNPFTDYAPRPFGTDLYYSTIRSDSVIDVMKMKGVDYYSKIYKAPYQQNGEYGSGVAVEGAINSAEYHTGNGAFSTDGSKFYFTQCYTKKKKMQVRCDIYVSKKNGDSWGEPEKLSDAVNAKKKMNTHPAIGIGEDGKEYLYFTSNREGSIGGTDIWYAENQGNDGFAAPVNAGAKINTSSDESTPYYDNKNKKLYFSSNGLTNIGGMDVYGAKGSGAQWNDPQHTGYPLNSSVDDQYFFMDEKEENGFFVSNRPSRFSLKSETCCDDIYAFKIIKEIYLDAFVAKKSQPEVPIGDADVSVFTVNGAVLAPLSTFKTDTMEHFILPLDPEKVYQFNATKNGFWGSEEIIDMKTISVKDTLFRTFFVEEIVRRKIKLKKIYYEFDKYDITKLYKKTLDSLHLVLTENPKFTLLITGHCDAKGTNTYNDTLGRQRAQSAADYLMAKDIAQERLTLASKGEAEPIAPNTKENGADDPKGRAKNRRVEFKVNTNDPNLEIEIEYEEVEPASTK